MDGGVCRGVSGVWGVCVCVCYSLVYRLSLTGASVKSWSLITTKLGSKIQQEFFICLWGQRLCRGFFFCFLFFFFILFFVFVLFCFLCFVFCFCVCLFVCLFCFVFLCELLSYSGSGLIFVIQVFFKKSKSDRNQTWLKDSITTKIPL